MRTGDGFLCVYSVTLEPSFAAVTRFYDHICRVKDLEELPFIMVGNKCDLMESRVISTEKGQQLADELGVKFLETSAKTRHNVAEMFTEIVRMIRAWKAENEKDAPEPASAKKKKGCFLL
jgi:GTPase SAR1 family protein